MLNNKQQAFVREYLIDLNATQAAIRSGYSPKTANEQGARLLANASVKAEIQSGMDKRAERTELNADDVIESIRRIRAKAEEQDKLSEALKANELLGKHLRLFTDKVEHTGAMNLIVSTGIPTRG